MHSGASKAMPLKIESATYTVNRPAKKNSKFMLWKNWRRSVHEDRGGEERRSRSKAGRSEVAGLGDSEDVSSTVTLVPDGGGADRTTRRTRPLSLAVQPLNYQRLDPDHNLAPLKHPNMTSQESIGSCSLDIEQSASDRSEATRRSLSEKTLHSLNLSCNGETDKLKNGNSEQTQKSSPNDKLTISNGHHATNELDQLIAKKPSYLGLACSISGYSGITRYDSKLREGFRSRDSSPGTRLVNRDTSPASFRSNENLNVPSHPHPPKSQSISPLAMDRQNGFSNGLKETRRIESYAETKRFTDVVDKGMSQTVFPDFSPIRPVNKSPAKGGLNSSNDDSFSSTYPNSSFKSTSSYVSSYTESSVINGSSVEEHNNSTGSQKSFIQQRVERLYGPGALAQGFFFKRSAVTKSNTSVNNLNKSNSNNSSLDNSNVEESLKNLPVLRHLRPEFRAQLPVVNQRRPTDGSEQVIKPLQRLSLSAKKDETKETPVVPPVVNEIVSPCKTVQMSASVTSLTDQQPAAPKVVLPVIKPSTNSSTKQATEAKEVRDEDKDGHYFMNLLEKERDRLISLAESAEAELENTANLPEEAAGKLRSAAGKSRLLATQKMHQFMGLCQKNINQIPGEEFPTTNEDIAGFWDMVMLQVVQVNKLFEQIDHLRSSQWKELSAEAKPNSVTAAGSSITNASKKRVPSTKTKSSTAASNSEAARKAREAREQSRRQMLEERRRAMRSQNAKNTTDSVEIFVPET